MSSRRTRTPEEIAKSIEIAKSVMEQQKKRDGMNSVRYGRMYVLLAAVFYIIHSAVMYSYNMKEDFYLYTGLTGLYVILALIYPQNPLVISIVAFSIFILIILMQAIINPLTLFGGIIFFFLKIAVITGLIASMRNAIKFKRELESQNKNKSSNDILDDGLIEI